MASLWPYSGYVQIMLCLISNLCVVILVVLSVGSDAFERSIVMAVIGFIVNVINAVKLSYLTN